ncbi:YceD family protein [Caldalkalibacillus thermarum]|uniref:YceD family protein n=1 Tax=Caldalkalibacillus thermarum TaxID=296745 RepID=UPI00166C8CDB|nr:YceD family protein [Caldalkalibacillus thermarum]
MKIPTHRILHLAGKSLPLHETYDMGALTERHKQLLSIRPVEFNGEGYLASGLFVVKGTVKGEYTLSCSRCLAELERSFNQSFEERFDLHPEQHRFNEDDEQEDIHPVHENMLDLTPYIEQQVLLSIPFIPACEDEASCRANMLQEGKDWSIAREEEQKEKVDPRLAELAKLLKKDQ